MFSRKVFLGVIVLLLAVAGAAGAVTLPDTSSTTTLTASVSEQAQVTVPAGVTFNVTNITSSTAASAASVSASNIVLASATKRLKVSVQAAAASFSSPGSTSTWAASDVSWNAASWTAATGAAGSLSNSAYTEVATCTADVTDCSTSALVFTLASKSTVTRSGSHTLNITWKFESI